MTRTDPEARDKVEPTIWDALIGAAIGVLLIYAGSFIGNRVLKWPVVGLGWIFVAVMTAYVVAVIWTNVSGRVWAVISRLRGDVRKDPQLGTLTLDRRIRCWEAEVARGDRIVDVLIGGADEPNPALLARARDVVANFDALEREVNAYLAREADRGGEDPEIAAEIRALRISSLKIWSREHPGLVQIDFRGPDEDRFWSCEHENGEFGPLDFD